MTRKRKFEIIYLVFIIFAVFGLSFVYRQMLFAQMEADYQDHLLKAISGDSLYSLSELIMKILQPLGGENLVALFFSICTGGSIWATYMLLCELDSLMRYKEASVEFKLTASVGINLATPIYIPKYYAFFYKNQLAYNAWHSDTYILMKFFGILSLIYFFRIKRDYLKSETVTIANYVYFALFLFLATWAKPSYFFGFAPTMVMFLIIDLVKNRTKKGILKKIIVFAAMNIPSGLVVLYQYFLKFVHDFASDGENKIVFGFSPVFIKGSLLRKLFCCYFYPVFILAVLFCVLRLIEDELIFLWGMTFANLLIDLFVYEDGPRMMHGNFDWGLIMANGLLFAVSVYILGVLFAENRQRKFKIGGKIMLICSTLIVIYQVVLGVIWVYYSWFEVKDYLF